jgi:hypothetical protein
MIKRKGKKMIKQLFQYEEKINLVNYYDEYDWDELIKQEQVVGTTSNEWLDSEYLLEDTDRDYIRCN